MRFLTLAKKAPCWAKKAFLWTTSPPIKVKDFYQKLPQNVVWKGYLKLDKGHSWTDMGPESVSLWFDRALLSQRRDLLAQ